MSRQITVQVKDETFVKIGTYVAQEKLKRRVTQQEAIGELLDKSFEEKDRNK